MRNNRMRNGEPYEFQFYRVDPVTRQFADMEGIPGDFVKGIIMSASFVGDNHATHMTHTDIELDFVAGYDYGRLGKEIGTVIESDDFIVRFVLGMVAWRPTEVDGYEIHIFPYVVCSIPKSGSPTMKAFRCGYQMNQSGEFIAVLIFSPQKPTAQLMSGLLLKASPDGHL